MSDHFAFVLILTGFLSHLDANKCTCFEEKLTDKSAKPVIALRVPNFLKHFLQKTSMNRLFDGFSRTLMDDGI